MSFDHESAAAGARKRWPEIDLAPSVFGAYARKRLASRAGRDAGGKLFLEDLYLACACLERAEGAIERLEREYLQPLVTLLHGQRLADPAEVVQDLRVRLLVAHGGDSPRLARYSGRGDLLSFLRATALRLAVDVARADKRRRGTAQLEEALERPDSAPDPELAFLKRRYRKDFGQALQAGIASLSAQQRNLLRQQLVHGLSLDELARLHRVHRATAARWLADARMAVIAATRRALKADLRLDTRELESAFKVIQSNFGVSMGRLLHESEATE